MSIFSGLSLVFSLCGVFYHRRILNFDVLTVQQADLFLCVFHAWFRKALALQDHKRYSFVCSFNHFRVWGEKKILLKSKWCPRRWRSFMFTETGCGLRKWRNSSKLWPSCGLSLRAVLYMLSYGLIDYGQALGCLDPRLKWSLTAFDQGSSSLPVTPGHSCGCSVSWLPSLCSEHRCRLRGCEGGGRQTQLFFLSETVDNIWLLPTPATT